ncbi:signal peptide protein [Rhodopirellula maiorica SM1]|uniref:Signal peptide protein n=1 Tax=Rhodopirellula maiorica SM1 TaxID=1265738 RepID=M5RUS8_9BACT|nr:hypothetical protein [Rhodopirellula maiorica]EMI23055.1 signal peptide protein [Rhodopirellula maiorica SM1]
MLGILVMGSSVGCSAFNLPGFSPGEPGANYVPAGIAGGYRELDETMDSVVYQKVRQAQAENSIVLQVAVDHDEPVRVLPLPPESSGRSVFVSNLLKQTGVLQKLGAVNAVLYRSSPQAIGGIRMEVQMNDSHTVVLPESDYALKPGDRLYVTKSAISPIQTLVTQALGL